VTFHSSLSIRLYILTNQTIALGVYYVLNGSLFWSAENMTSYRMPLDIGILAKYENYNKHLIIIRLVEYGYNIIYYIIWL